MLLSSGLSVCLYVGLTDSFSAVCLSVCVSVCLVLPSLSIKQQSKCCPVCMTCVRCTFKFCPSCQSASPHCDILTLNCYIVLLCRKVIADAVAADPFTYNDGFLGKSNEEYRKWILDPKKWGGAIELSIFAR